MTASMHSWKTSTIKEVLRTLPSGNKIDQGWSPRCERRRSEGEHEWGALKTTAIQDGAFHAQHTKKLPDHLDPREELEVNSGDILMTCAGPRSRCGVVCRVPLVRRKLFISGKMYRFLPDPLKLDPDFFVYMLRSPKMRWEIDQIKTGGSESGLNLTQGRFLSLNISYPSLAEQKRIVEKLDGLFANIEETRDPITSILHKSETLRASILSAVFNGSLLSQQRTGRQVIEIGDLVEDITQGWSPKCPKESTDDPNEWAVLTTSAIQKVSFDSSQNKRLPANLEPREHLEVFAGDILITRAGPRSRCGICCYVEQTTQKRIFSDKVYRVSLNQSIDPQFFVLVMNTPEMTLAIDRIKSGGNDSGLNLTQGRLKSLKIGIWELSIQRAVVDKTKQLLSEISVFQAIAREQLKSLDRLERSVLAKAFHGNLVDSNSIRSLAKSELSLERSEV